MLDTDTMVFAVVANEGHDIFERRDDANERRARFRWLATVKNGDDGLILVHKDRGASVPDAVLSGAVGRLVSAQPLNTRYALSDPRTWPRAEPGLGAMDVFLYHDFFRAWLVADLALSRFRASALGQTERITQNPQSLVGGIAQAYAFNRHDLASTFAQGLVPPLARLIATPGWTDDKRGSTGYALRMLGDLCERAGDAEQALTCFETAVAAGDNAFRRRRAIELAKIVGKHDVMTHHLDAYRKQWALPPDLAALVDESPR